MSSSVVADSCRLRKRKSVISSQSTVPSELTSICVIDGKGKERSQTDRMSGSSGVLCKWCVVKMLPLNRQKMEEEKEANQRRGAVEWKEKLLRKFVITSGEVRKLVKR